MAKTSVDEHISLITCLSLDVMLLGHTLYIPEIILHTISDLVTEYLFLGPFIHFRAKLIRIDLIVYDF